MLEIWIDTNRLTLYPTMVLLCTDFQLADTKRNLATESKARHALQRQIQGLTRDLARQQAKEKVLDDELSSFGVSPKSTF